MNSLRARRKLIIFSIVIIIIIRFFPYIFLGTYDIINKVDSTIYARYATNNKFDENVFLDYEVINETGLYEQLNDRIDAIWEVNQIQEFARIIYDNKDEFKEIISNNTQYQEYLVKIDSSTDEVIEWIDRMYLLDVKMIMASLYITFFILSLIMVVPFGYRKSFYVLAGVLYIIAILSNFTDGISDYLVINVASVFGMFPQNESIYKDLEGWRMIFPQAFKESTLTFIIFDTVIQIWLNNYKEKTKKAIHYLYASLEIQCSYLSQFENATNKYIAKLKIANDIMRMCYKNIRQNIRQNVKRINKKKTPTEIKNNLEKKNERLSMLMESLQVCRSNSDEYTTKEYISLLRKVQCLMYQCNLVQK